MGSHSYNDNPISMNVISKLYYLWLHNVVQVQFHESSFHLSNIFQPRVTQFGQDLCNCLYYTIQIKWFFCKAYLCFLYCLFIILCVLSIWCTSEYFLNQNLLIWKEVMVGASTVLGRQGWHKTIPKKKRQRNIEIY